jgi:hypothetical protein
MEERTVHADAAATTATSARATPAVAVPTPVWPSLLAGTLALGLVVWMAWQEGGYFPWSFLTAGAIAFAALAMLLALGVPRHRLSTHALVGLAALTALAGWTGLSALWSTTPDGALLALQRDLLYAGLFALALIAAGSGRFTRQVVWMVLATILLITGAGLVSRIYPGILAGGEGSPAFTRYRLDYPLGYWNAFGALAAMGTVLGFGLSADPRSPVLARAAAAGGAVLMFVAMYLSLSRGAWLALAVGLVVLAALGAWRGSLLFSALIVGVASTLAVLRLGSYPALTDSPASGSGQAAAGEAYGPQLILLAAGAVVAQGMVAAGRTSPFLMLALRRTFRPLAIGACVLLALFAIVVYGLRASSVEGWSAARLDSASDFVSRQWEDFLRPTTFSETGTARLTTAKGTRSDLYRVAFDGFEARPVLGEGAGSFEYRWMRTRRVDEKVRNAHSLELETLGELGLVGGLLLITFLGSVVVAAVRARVRPGGLARSQAAAVGAACSVWVAHSMVDWDWQMPALTGTALILAATLYPYGRRRRLSGGDGETSRVHG